MGQSRRSHDVSTLDQLQHVVDAAMGAGGGRYDASLRTRERRSRASGRRLGPQDTAREARAFHRRSTRDGARGTQALGGAQGCCTRRSPRGMLKRIGNRHVAERGGWRPDCAVVLLVIIAIFIHHAVLSRRLSDGCVLHGEIGPEPEGGQVILAAT